MKRILLIGAGHAHLVVLRQLAKQALYGARIAVVAPYERQLYSGMLPGLIAGHYRLPEVVADVAAMAARAHAEFIPGTVASLDAGQRVARLEDGSELEYDLLSLNVGSLVSTAIPGSAEHALAVKPFDAFLARLNEERFARVAVAGAGAAGMELAMALRHRGAAVTLYSDRPSMSPALAGRAANALRRSGVDFRPGMPVTSIEAGPLVVAGPTRQDFDHVLLATGVAPIAFPGASGLLCDERGFVRVHRTLRSLSHAEVFAAGDCASVHEAPHPKSGVYSVRHGAILHENLRRSVTRDGLLEYRPQHNALALLTCGARYAIAERGGWSAEGRWAWHLKDWIDRRWLKSLAAQGFKAGP